jgi:hypothetical protein
MDAMRGERERERENLREEESELRVTLWLVPMDQ